MIAFWFWFTVSYLSIGALVHFIASKFILCPPLERGDIVTSLFMWPMIVVITAITWVVLMITAMRAPKDR